MNEINVKTVDAILESIDNKFNELMVELEQLNATKVDTSILKYITLRNKLSVARKSFEMFENYVKSQQMVINTFLIQTGIDLGVESFKSEHGTAFQKVKKAYRVDDWDTYVEWLLATKNLHCVEKRPAKMAVEEIHNETGEVPPGLRFEQEIEFQFRKA